MFFGMVYNLIRLPAVMDQIAFQPGPDKLVNGLLDPAPVPAIIFQHPLVDGQAAIHLKVEDSLRLFVGEETVLHEPGDKIFFGKLAETFHLFVGALSWTMRRALQKCKTRRTFCKGNLWLSKRKFAILQMWPEERYRSSGK